MVGEGGAGLGGAGRDGAGQCGGGWMDGWRENSGSSQAHGPIVPFYLCPCQLRFSNAGSGDPSDLGSCVVELVTCQFMVKV